MFLSPAFTFQRDCLAAIWNRLEGAMLKHMSIIKDDFVYAISNLGFLMFENHRGFECIRNLATNITKTLSVLESLP